MKRLPAVIMAAISLLTGRISTQAQNVQLSLNLRYADPADVSEGGRWFLMAKTDDPDGIASIDAYVLNIDVDGIVFGNPTAVGWPGSDARYPIISPTTTGADVSTPSGGPFSEVIDGAVRVVYGQNLVNGPITSSVGRPGGPASFANDPLQNVAWNSAALIISGTFGAVRPTFATNVGPSGVNTTAKTLQGSTPGLPATEALTTFAVRGDSLASDNLEGNNEGLFRGDVDRDFDIDGDDLKGPLINWYVSFPNGTQWEYGDYNDDGHIDGDDLNAVLVSFNSQQAPPTSLPIPEPNNLLIAATGLLAAAWRRSAALSQVL